MKTLTQFIYEASLSSLLTSAISKIVDFAKNISEKISNKPYIILDSESNLATQQKHIFVKEAIYLREKMKEWFKTTSYSKLVSEKEGNMLIYYYNDSSESEINKIFEQACDEIDKINDELGTNKIDKNLMDKVSKEAESSMNDKQLSLFDPSNIPHEPYKVKQDSYRNNKTRYYLLEMFVDEGGNPDGGKYGYPIYPGVYIEKN